MNTTMHREIMAQPPTLTQTIPSLRQHRAQQDDVGSARRIFAGGCGDSLFSAQVATDFFAQAGCAYEAASALDFCHYRRLTAGDLCVLISISGNTRRTVEAASVARKAGARTLAITCNAGSALADACDAVLPLGFTPISRRTPHTLDFAITLAALAVIAEHAAGQRWAWLDAWPANLTAAISRAEAGAAAMTTGAGIATRWFFLGAGAGMGLAAYAAAKFHEAGGLPAYAAESENFMHGMNFMPNPDDRLCMIIHDQPSLARAISIAECLRPIGLKPWLVWPDGTLAPSDLAIPDLSFSPGALGGCVAPLQLLCLHHANRLGLAVEQPRAGLAGGSNYVTAQSRYFAGT